MNQVNSDFYAATVLFVCKMTNYQYLGSALKLTEITESGSLALNWI